MSCSVEDFIESVLVNDAQQFARETVRLRDEYIRSAQALLTTELRESVHHAAWLAAHALDVAYRWSELRRMAARWYEIHPEVGTLNLDWLTR